MKPEPEPIAHPPNGAPSDSYGLHQVIPPANRAETTNTHHMTWPTILALTNSCPEFMPATVAEFERSSVPGEKCLRESAGEPVVISPRSCMMRRTCSASDRGGKRAWYDQAAQQRSTEHAQAVAERLRVGVRHAQTYPTGTDLQSAPSAGPPRPVDARGVRSTHQHRRHRGTTPTVTYRAAVPSPRYLSLVSGEASSDTQAGATSRGCQRRNWLGRPASRTMPLARRNIRRCGRWPR